MAGGAGLVLPGEVMAMGVPNSSLSDHTGENVKKTEPRNSQQL